MPDIQIVVVAHKPCRMPEGAPYLPLLVGGAAGAWQRDSTGEHISGKNPWFCELTGLYWAWKNLAAGAIGLVHYRRHFTVHTPTWRERAGDLLGLGQGEGKWQRLLTEDEAAALLRKAPVILPPKRGYLIESVGSHFAHAHGTQPLERLEAVMRARAPQALPVWQAHLAGRTTHLFNMFLMRRDVLDAYAAWLFDLLFALEATWPTPPKRIFGHLSERLLDVWLTINQVPWLETPAMFMGAQNWLKKGAAFVRRKYSPASFLRGVA